MQKNYRLEAVAPSLGFGKGGPLIKSSAGALVLRNPTDTADATLSGASPVASSDFATKQYVDAAVVGPTDDPSSPESVALLLAGEWLEVKVSNDRPSAGGTYSDAIFLGTMPVRTSWTIEGVWDCAAIGSTDIVSSSIQLFRGVIQRNPTGEPSIGSAAMGVLSSGSLTGNLIAWRVSGNDVWLQTRISAALARRENLAFRFRQTDPP